MKQRICNKMSTVVTFLGKKALYETVLSVESLGNLGREQNIKMCGEFPFSRSRTTVFLDTELPQQTLSSLGPLCTSFLTSGLSCPLRIRKLSFILF